MRLGFEVSRFPDFCEGGLACAELPRGVEFGALYSHFFLHILKKKKKKRHDSLEALARSACDWLVFISDFISVPIRHQHMIGQESSSQSMSPRISDQPRNVKTDGLEGNEKLTDTLKVNESL